MIKILDIIEGEQISYDTESHLIFFKAKFAVDVDGSGESHGDKYFQSDTSLHHNGKPLNADEDLYGVLPPQIVKGVAPIVLGCLGLAKNTKNGRRTFFVTGDIGPKKKIGEGSRALAIALGINPSPVSGGEDAHIIEWYFYPGVAAQVNGKDYNLQSLQK